VVAPDLRGYHLSDKPRGVWQYAGGVLADDIAGLVDALGERQAVIVGHDWGAAVGWIFAMGHPKRLAKLVILNVPHPERMLRALRTWRQLKRSWYAFFFQLPWLPEAVFRSSCRFFLSRAFSKGTVRKSAFTDGEIERYCEALLKPGSLTAAINYYRAAMREAVFGRTWQMSRIEQPVLVLWGEQDPFLGPETAEPSAAWVPNVKVVRFGDAGHWVHIEQPERVNRSILEFLRS
jgi:epoxide hydrolase 4